MPLPERNHQKVMAAMTLLIEAIGCDPTSETFKDTPKRVAKMYDQILDGNFAELGRMTAFTERVTGDMVMVHHVPFYAFCAHHWLQFEGHFGIAYIPNKKVLGLSKLVRVFRHGCKIPTTHEEVVANAANLMMKVAEPKGCAVYATASHSCMCLRGVKSPGSLTTVPAVRGVFAEDAELRQRFFSEASK